MTDELSNSIDATTGGGLSRRTVMAGAAWSLPVVAVAVATPGASASPGTPTDISVTLQPTPALPGSPLRLTYRGTDPDFEFVPFPAGSTVLVTITGVFTVATIDGASITTDNDGDPRVLTLAITDLERFYIQGTGSAGASIAVQVTDGNGTVIGSDLTTINEAP